VANTVDETPVHIDTERSEHTHGGELLRRPVVGKDIGQRFDDLVSRLRLRPSGQRISRREAWYRNVVLVARMQ
jgi:hypothetical protein